MKFSKKNSSDKFQFVKQMKTAADHLVSGCAILCHVGAKCGYFVK